MSAVGETPLRAERAGRVDALIAALDHEGKRRSLAVIARIVRLGAEAVPALARSVRGHPQVRIRAWSATALGALAAAGVRGTTVALRAALSDPAMSVRLHAVRAIADAGVRRLGAALIPLLRDPSGGVRGNVPATLVRLGVRRAGPALRRACRDDRWYVRLEAVRAIAALHIPAASALRGLRDDPRPGVRAAARAGLTPPDRVDPAAGAGATPPAVRRRDAGSRAGRAGRSRN